MLYTFLGAFIGGILTYIFCKWTRVNFTTGTGFFSDAGIYMFVGILIGAGAGFGYGVSALLSGNHVVQRLWKLWK